MATKLRKRKRGDVPQMHQHSSGQARVVLSGRTCYCGRSSFGSVTFPRAATERHPLQHRDELGKGVCGPKDGGCGGCGLRVLQVRSSLSPLPRPFTNAIAE